MIDRRSVLFAGAGALLIAGCARTNVNQLLTSGYNYQESFDSFAMSPKGDILLVLGEKFDYVFTPPESLVTALRLPSLRPRIKTQFDSFGLQSPTELAGTWILFVLKKEVSADEERLLREVGFSDGVSGSTEVWMLKGTIAGTRYLKNQATKLTQLEKTNKPYVIAIGGGPVAGIVNHEIETIPASRNGSGALILLGILLLPLLLSGGICTMCK